jgi:putative SOS response-associated peptidase YedK
VELIKWGITVPWMSKLLINIRDDSIFEKPWTKRYTKNRCIIGIDGFYEWLDLKDDKTPFYIGIEGQEWMGLAGVYVTEKDAQGNEMKCFAIITTEANEVVKKVHARMPVILFRQEEETWLEPGIKDMSYYENTLSPYPEDMMFAYPVSKRVNNPKNNDGWLKQPWRDFKSTTPGPQSVSKMIEAILG